MTEASQQTKDQKPHHRNEIPKGPVPYDDGDIGEGQNSSTNDSKDPTQTGGGGRE